MMQQSDLNKMSFQNVIALFRLCFYHVFLRCHCFFFMPIIFDNSMLPHVDLSFKNFYLGSHRPSIAFHDVGVHMQSEVSAYITGEASCA